MSVWNICMVNVQQNYVDMRNEYVNMQLDFVASQQNYYASLHNTGKPHVNIIMSTYFILQEEANITFTRMQVAYFCRLSAI